MSYLEGERVPKNWGIVTERIGKVLDCLMNSMFKSGGMKEFKFGGDSPCTS